MYYVGIVITTCTGTSETSCASVDLISACLLLMNSVSIKTGRIRSKHDLSIELLSPDCLNIVVLKLLCKLLCI
jgi:hypothetical protein